MKRRFTTAITLLFLLLTNFQPVNAQKNNPLGSWYIYNGFFNISPRVELFFESQLRTWEVISNPQVFFLRPYFNYNVTKNFQAGLGLEYHSNWTFETGEDRVRTEEFRTTLQVMLFHEVDRVSFQHRYRYEFRFLDEQGKQRTRYRIQLGIPITSDSMKKGVFFATVGNEFMVNTQPEINLSQMRSYAMLGYQFTKSLNFQSGYMYISRPGGEGWHRLQFFLTHKLYFYD